MEWENVDRIPCDPQALIGYGGDAHRRSKGNCLYCGFGTLRTADPELKFDIWRNLTLEHVVPECNGQLEANIDQAIQNLPMATQEGLKRRIKSLNEVTACHVCNTFAGRCETEGPISEAVQAFYDRLQHPIADETWLPQVAQSIQGVWQLKSKRVRGKVLWLRENFRCNIGPELDTFLPAQRTGPTPEDLDEVFRSIQDRILSGLGAPD